MRVNLGRTSVCLACVTANHACGRFLFRVGHLLGHNNVIDRLRKKGYTVKHIPVSESIEG